MRTKSPCGTAAAAQRHYKNGEKPCEPCRLALNEYMRRRNKGELTPRVFVAEDPTISSVPDGTGHGVYVLFGGNDEVLYIGRSRNVRRRLHNHKSLQPWWPEVTRVEWTPCDGIHEARSVEKSMIRTFRPDANINDWGEVHRSTRQKLPDWAAAKLIGLFEDAVDAGQKHTPEDDLLNGYILAMRNKGWTLGAIGFAMGVSREAVRLRQKAALWAYDKPGVPALPVKPKPVKKVRPTIPPGALVELRELQTKAVTVRGWTPLDAPERAASERYSELLADWHLQGVSISQIAKQMGVTHLAIRARLARHGYMGEVKGLDQPAYGTPWIGHHQRPECKAGHPLSGDNLRLVGGDPRRRVCKACDVRRGREYKARLAQKAESA